MFQSEPDVVTTIEICFTSVSAETLTDVRFFFPLHVWTRTEFMVAYICDFQHVRVDWPIDLFPYLVISVGGGGCAFSSFHSVFMSPCLFTCVLGCFLKVHYARGLWNVCEQID